MNVECALDVKLQYLDNLVVLKCIVLYVILHLIGIVEKFIFKVFIILISKIISYN